MAQFEVASQSGMGTIVCTVGEPGKVMPPEFWAKQATNRVIGIADTAAGPIRDQAHAFRDQIFQVVLHEIKNAINERKSRDALLVGIQSPELSQMIQGDK